MHGLMIAFHGNSFDELLNSAQRLHSVMNSYGFHRKYYSGTNILFMYVLQIGHTNSGENNISQILRCINKLKKSDLPISELHLINLSDISDLTFMLKDSE